jgi:cell division protein FtsL
MAHTIKKSLSYCAGIVRRWDPVGTKRMCKCFFWIALITALAILQVHIRFKIRDLQMERFKLQEEKSHLLDMRNKLQSKIEALNRGDRIGEIAQNELGLVQFPANRLEHLRISESVVQKYKAVAFESRKAETLTGSSSLTARETLLARLGSLLGIHEVSQAREY